MLEEIGISGNANEELKLGVGGSAPEEDDEDGEDESAHGVDPPAQF